MEHALASSLSERKTIAFSLTLYAALRLVLAAEGLYAILAYYVSQRSQELGIRMAPGADAREIGPMVLKRGSALIGLGVSIGAVRAVALTRLLRQMLFGIEPTDPTTFVSACFFVAAIALASCFVPAWRAIRVDPMVALQAE